MEAQEQCGSMSSCYQGIGQLWVNEFLAGALLNAEV